MTGNHGAWAHGRHAVTLHSTNSELWARTVTWMTAALASDRKVFYLGHDRDPLSDRAERLASSLLKVSGRRLVDVVAEPAPADASACSEDSYEWHLDLLLMARRQGFRGAAFTGDRQLHRGVRVEQDAVAHERVLERVAARPGARVLCRFNPQLLSRGTAGQIVRAHFRNVDDAHWGADVVDGGLMVSGDIDRANVDRFRHVLDAAVLAGVLTVDLTEVGLLGADGLGVLARTASGLAESGRCLLLVNLPPLVHRTLSVLGLADHPGLRIEEPRPAVPSGPG